MKFFIENTNKSSFDGTLQYIVDEHSFIYEPWGNSNFSIILGKEYTSLDVDINSSTVLHVSGLNSMDNWIHVNINVPFAKNGLLKISNCEDMLSGSGMNYKENWVTKFDKNTNWVYIGPIKNNYLDDLYVKFANNSIAAIKNGELTGIWVKPIFI